jgi:hypothetical protein
LCVLIIALFGLNVAARCPWKLLGITLAHVTSLFNVICLI